MINITGFEPLDLILLDSSDKTNKIVSFIKMNPSEYIQNNFNNFLNNEKIDFLNDLTYNDLMRVSAELKKKGLSF
jgi:hypothetical protein